MPSEALNMPALAGELLGMEPRAVPYAVVSYEAFRVSQGFERGKGFPLHGRTLSLGIIEASTLDEAVAAALARAMIDHKETLLIRETGTKLVRWASTTEERPFDLLHVFQIKRKADPRYVYEGHERKRVHDLYAAPVVTVDCAAIGGGE